ncbi:MAG: hypothetical protein KF883_01200 [Thermomicrobiales bacterium]|nr:hypothetical protein [Thermomicrobiales bacterium]
MNKGSLADYFTGVAAKRLSAVEADPGTSNQHEFNGVADLRRILGTPDQVRRFPAKLVYLSDNDPDPVVEDADLTWYDSRRNQPKRSPEWRLYFPGTSVTSCASPGDLLVLGRRPDDTILLVIAGAESTVANQLLWLFNLEEIDGHPGFSVREELESEHDRLNLTSRVLLESLGIVVEVSEESYLDRILESFPDGLPTTEEFSAFAREAAGEMDVSNEPDVTLVAWMDKEEILFRTFEHHLILDRLNAGFDEDVDGFMQFSLSVQNRRKSRVGNAFEHHVAAVFENLGVLFSRRQVTENRSRPDFLFPGVDMYRDPAFPQHRLTMLGAKSTCKDRWRQVLSEANRIPRKHLLTLEPAISQNQTDQMIANGLQLVVPNSLKATYTQGQQDWLMDLQSFISLVKERQQC